MNRRNFCKRIVGSLPLLVIPSIALSSEVLAHDFTSDLGLRRAIESLFSQVDPEKGSTAEDLGFSAYITYGVGSRIPGQASEERLRRFLFQSISGRRTMAHVKREGYPIYVMSDQAQIMKWRRYPITTTSSDPWASKGSPTLEVKSTMRLVWKDIE